MSPADYAQAQLERYNAHDLEGFLALYAEDVEIYDFPTTLCMQGRAAMRERYGKILYPGATVKAVVSQRIVCGSRVIDHEQVSGHPISGEASLAVIYEVGAAGIEKVWFIR
ncbi:nuclear transport factor 2 family protein [Chitinimonas sp.]|uniref:nuclear transport factor 2 family protein n=1 Tax=Chitinimonas sp. TaxID=1934313 RepID=UPI002F92A0DD